MPGAVNEAQGGGSSARNGKTIELALAALVVLSLAVPGPALAQDDSLVTVRAPGVSVSPGECRPWIGVRGQLFQQPFHTCVLAEADIPSFVLSYYPSNGTQFRTTDCDNSTGVKATYRGTWVGACAIYKTKEPDPDTFVTSDVKLEPCKFNGEEARDPTVQVEGGGVAVCVRVVFDPDHKFPPPTNVSPEPCDRRKSFDPKITIQDGGAQVCVDYYLFGLTPDVDTPDPPSREDVIRRTP